MAGEHLLTFEERELHYRAIAQSSLANLVERGAVQPSEGLLATAAQLGTLAALDPAVITLMDEFSDQTVIEDVTIPEGATA